LDFSRYLIIGMGHLLLMQAIAPLARADSPPTSATAPARAASVTADPPLPWYIILNSPLDLNELLLRIKGPDLVIKADQPGTEVERSGAGGNRVDSPRWVVKSVHVRGQIEGEFANLKVDFTLVVRGAGQVWAPIRLDDQWLMGAREAGRDLDLRKGERKEWQVKLAGEGEHHVQVELKVPVSAKPTRKTLSLAIPLAASTSLELDFSERESDIIIGENEYFGQKDLGDGKGTRLTAHLWPRSTLVVSWTNAADSGARNPALLTAQGEIAIDIDSEQMRARSSWAIGCVRGMTRVLEIRIDDEDKVTELLLDDQSIEAGIERVPGTGKLTIRLAEMLRPGASKRLVLKTRRTFSISAPRRISFTGFPLTNAREQSGFIGITQSPNIWLSPVTSRGLRRIDTSFLPKILRERPATIMAFEFLDQPFLLDLGVDPAPPLVQAETKALFRVDSNKARSETTIELQWVTGSLFEVELGVAAGLQVDSVGPPDVVESSSLSPEIAGGDHGDMNQQARRLKIRLTPLARDQNKVTLRLKGIQPILREGPVKLGLFTRDQSTSVSASYALIADRGLALDLDDESGRIEKASALKFQAQGSTRDWPWAAVRGETSSPPLLLADDGDSKYLPIRITRRARSLSQDTAISAQVTRRWVELLQQTTFSVRFGALSSLEIRVPAAIADRWELLDKEIVDREELGKEADGAKRYRLIFSRPVLDKTTLRFRYRLPLVPSLAAKVARDVSIPWISFSEGRAGPTTVGLSLAPEIVLEGTGSAWVRSSEDVLAESIGDGPVIQYTEEESGRQGRPFTFKAMALEPVPLPPIVVPRLLLKTVRDLDDSIRTRALYWVESHGPDFPFALPEGARWIGARVDGRIAEAVDYDSSRSSYRLRFPSDVVSKPVLVELEFQASGQGVRSRWEAPRLLDGGVVLQVLWEARLPWNLEMVGVPRGWSDENQWYWDGYVWKQRPWRKMSSLNEWILGTTTTPTAIDEFDGANPDDSHRYLFSRSGQPVALSVWVVSRPWLVSICSGVTLLIGFFTIFSKIRFRTIWLGIAAIGLLAAVLFQGSVMFLALQYAFIGMTLTLLGLVIERLLERSRSPSIPVRDSGLIANQQTLDSSLNRSLGVGSDDSTAIRVRAPSTSTLDFVPAPISVPPSQDEARSSTLERARSGNPPG